MPVSFDIKSATGNYDIHIGSGLLEAVLAAPGERIYMVDEFLAAPLVRAGLDPIVLAADESTKSLERMTEVIEAMKTRSGTRGTTVVAIGGGVVQDTATFVASVYMRGVPWLCVPTTLLSMTDSCIGGKSSINVGSFKNIVGTFHPPEQVIIDPVLATTLSAEQRVAGLCEAAKICMCHGLDTLDQYLALSPTVDCDSQTLAELFELCLRAKKWFIEIDEFDRKERLVLNFGHTFGHAIEAASNFAISHGVAVGLGMIAALHLSNRLGHDCEANPRVIAFHDHIRQLLAGMGESLAPLRSITVPDLMVAFNSDKKHSRENFAVILVNRDGAVERMLLPRNDGSAAIIADSFERMLAEFSSRNPAGA